MPPWPSLKAILHLEVPAREHGCTCPTSDSSRRTLFRKGPSIRALIGGSSAMLAASCQAQLIDRGGEGRAVGLQVKGTELIEREFPEMDTSRRASMSLCPFLSTPGDAEAT